LLDFFKSIPPAQKNSRQESGGCERSLISSERL